MGMTIDESIDWVKKTILDMRKAQICISDRLALETAIDTMCKYQKIQDIVERFKNQYDHTTSMDLMMEIKEVIEDGN